MTEVVATLIWEDDKFMICQRPAHKTRGLLWEFVGGKVELGKTKERALSRECQEDLAVTLSVGEVFMDVVHEYPDFTVHLTLFNITIAKVFRRSWSTTTSNGSRRARISNYDFFLADDEILTKIIEVYNND